MSCEQVLEIVGAAVARPEGEERDDTDLLTKEPAKVILFNDEIHTFDEVIGQLIKALGCDSQKAEAMAWEVHLKGKAIVFDGTMNECLRVSAVLEEIALHTQIEV
jgi:ATP-dependent Clp protease adapter protein ClpS